MLDISKVGMIFSKPLGIHLVKLFYAVILLVVAALISKLLQTAVVFICKLIGVESLSSKTNFDTFLRKTGIKESPVELVGVLTFWISLLASGMAIIYSFGFIRAIEILKYVMTYISINVVSAIFMLVLAVIFGSLLSGLILFVGGLINLPGYKLIARINQYVVVIFGIVIGIDKLGVSASLFLARPDIILGFFALSGAIAFGLGCKDLASNFLSNFLRDDR